MQMNCSVYYIYIVIKLHVQAWFRMKTVRVFGPVRPDISYL